MDIQFRRLSWKDLVFDWLDWPEQVLRSSVLTAYAWDFDLLPWTAVLLAAPKDHVLGCVPESSLTAVMVSGDIGSAHVEWNRSISLDKQVRSLFRRELSSAGIEQTMVRHGLIPYDGGVSLGGKPLGFSKSLPPLSQLWFRSYLIPRTGKSLERLLRCLRALADERGRFFMRPYPDAALGPGDLSYYVGPEESSWEAFVFSHTTFSSENALGRPPDLEKKVIDTLADAVARSEHGTGIDFDTTSARLSAFGNIKITYYPPQHYRAMTRSLRNLDVICALRSRLVRLLGWPIFMVPCRLALSAALSRFAGNPPPQPLPYDPVAELRAYLSETSRKYPSFEASPFDAVWT